ncbi:hypothetical protein M409DRAFT_21166 [Zasmidium cellare ATCC 36951]|uniref:Uncharacterized protein n=1 Tax=Zasmidium cellare ATCC 36951 TaxID=1080233 RepID=A0A6A6CMN7_ZASCE|nr:uncharacterized protein M409DRAFT_21166 [Zasmidium cellare ATCC 36951]KAF2168415.1 hypothetical protein M409DRAFT_21166 [Zasmidium cellare ATCC 36951]
MPPVLVMDATTALTIYGFLMRMLRDLTPEVLKMVFEAFVRSFGNNGIRIQPDMQRANAAVAGPDFVRQQNGQTVLYYNKQRYWMHPALDVVHVLAASLNVPLNSALSHPSGRLKPNRRNILCRFFCYMTWAAITNTSVTYILPTVHRLTAPPSPNRLHRLVWVNILIHKSYYDHFSSQRAQTELHWLENNTQGLANHAPTLRHLRVRIEDKNTLEDQQRRLVRNGQPISINEEIMIVFCGMSILKGKQSLSARYLFPNSDEMEKERADLEGIAEGTGRKQVDGTKKLPTDRAVDKVRSSWAAVKALAKKAKNHWQMRPGESRRDSQLPADNPHENWDGTDPEVSLEDVRQGCPSPKDEEGEQGKKAS